MKNNMKKLIAVVLAFALCLALMGSSCEDVDATNGSAQDATATMSIGNRLASNQPTPDKIKYSLERHNLIKRALWVNGMEDEARALPCPVKKPLGYIVLLSESGAVVAKHVVDGKVSSLNSFLTPDSEYYEESDDKIHVRNKWLPDVDGSYGENDNGIFFFDESGEYWEWNGHYLYSSNPFSVKNPIVTYEAKTDE